MPKELTIYTLDFDWSSTNLSKLKQLAREKFPTSEGWRPAIRSHHGEDCVWARWRHDRRASTGVAYAILLKQTFNLID